MSYGAVCCSCCSSNGRTCDVPSSWTTTCGDGWKFVTEGCDDGDIKSGDGCSSKCAVESGWSCSGDAPSTCTACTNARSGEYYTGPSTGGASGCPVGERHLRQRLRPVVGATANPLPPGSCNNAAAGQYFTGSGGTNQGGCSTDNCTNLPNFGTFVSSPHQYAQSDGTASTSRTNSTDCAFKCSTTDTGCSGGCVVLLVLLLLQPCIRLT